MREALAGREVTVALDGVGGELGRAAALELLGLGWPADPVRLVFGEPTQASTSDLYAGA